MSLRATSRDPLTRMRDNFHAKTSTALPPFEKREEGRPVPFVRKRKSPAVPVPAPYYSIPASRLNASSRCRPRSIVSASVPKAPAFDPLPVVAGTKTSKIPFGLIPRMTSYF